MGFYLYGFSSYGSEENGFKKKKNGRFIELVEFISVYVMIGCYEKCGNVRFFRIYIIKCLFISFLFLVLVLVLERNFDQGVLRLELDKR